MANNTTLSAGTGDGDTIATDDIAGVKHQKIKVEFGGEDVATEVTTSTPLPIGNYGTFVVQENGAALTALQLIDDAIYADEKTKFSQVVQEIPRPSTCWSAVYISQVNKLLLMVTLARYH